MASRTAVRTASLIVAAAAGASVVSGAAGAAIFIAIENIEKKIIKIIKAKNNSKINFIEVNGLISIFSIVIRTIIKIKNNYLINFGGVVAIII